MGKKNSYKESLQHGHGKDLDPKDYWELKSDKNNSFKEHQEEKRLDGSKLGQYFPDDYTLGSPSSYDDYGEESNP